MLGTCYVSEVLIPSFAEGERTRWLSMLIYSTWLDTAHATKWEKTMSRYVIIGAAILWSSAASAITGNQLLQYCGTMQSETRLFESGVCAGYIEGVQHAVPFSYSWI